MKNTKLFRMYQHVAFYIFVTIFFFKVTPGFTATGKKINCIQHTLSWQVPHECTGQKR